jgi:UDP-4-amino-4,6-dideoxy-N-acetyl-beta-L-altrosamine N-acetyltransferase
MSSRPPAAALGACLRALEERDLPLILEWRNDPDILRFLDSYEPLSMHQHRRWFEGLHGDPSRAYLGIVDTDGELAGVIWLKQIDWRVRKAEVGIYLGRCRGQGLGKRALTALVRYAFDTLNLNKLWATVFSYNQPSMRLFEGAGFSREGLLRKETYREGKYHDVIRYGLLKEEMGR